MKSLIELFWFKYAQLQEAARAGDDLLTEILGHEIDPVLTAIYDEVASNVSEARIQFQFVLDLLQKEGDDVSSVLRQHGALTQLADRYFGEAGYAITKADPIAIPSVRKARMDEGFLNEAILDCMPDRISVITRDYRYLYANPLHAERLEERPMDLVGRHVIEFVGLQRFEKRVRPHLDQCFNGEPVDYTFAKEMEGRTVVVRCRMTPCRSSTGKVIGAILILQEIADRRRSIAA